ncbi:family 43 glycosylhydrolase [Algoriphagus namhaensis]
MKYFYLIFLLALVLCSSCFSPDGKDEGISFDIRNDLPRMTADGKIVDAHDGRILQHEGKFYWYGTQYGQTNGFTTQNTYVVYSSEDMKSWHYEGKLLNEQPKGVYYRPHVVFNPKTEKFVLWYNWYPKLWEGQFGVAVSDQPTGPFTILNPDVPVANSDLGVGDFGIFVDQDEQAYLSYNTIEGHRLSIEKLDDSFTSSTLENSGFLAEHVEAGSMFHREGIYYLMTDWTCCFCNQGAGARVYRAESPMGPFAQHGNINRYPGEDVSMLLAAGREMHHYEKLSPSGGEYLELWAPQTESISTLELVQFTGDRVGQCGEVDNPRVHEPIPKADFELEYFFDGEWYPLSLSARSMEELALRKIYRFEFPETPLEALRVKPLMMGDSSDIHISTVRPGSDTNHFRAYRVHPDRVGGVIIPAQQTYVMPLDLYGSTHYIWMGDLWGSASDGVKGHDYQYWSSPLEFYSNGNIKRMRWQDGWSVAN